MTINLRAARLVDWLYKAITLGFGLFISSRKGQFRQFIKRRGGLSNKLTSHFNKNSLFIIQQ